MMQASATGANEQAPIIIVRRRRIEDDGHHGGAWKIAFADFMTAMMALFLVLWLINAANEETKKSVASYFNPVKLVDRNRSKKGIWKSVGPSIEEEGSRTGNAEEKVDADGQATPSDGAAAAAAEAVEREASFIADPFATLDEIAAAERAEQANGAREYGTVGPADVETMRDPFAPVHWQSAEPREEGENPAERAEPAVVETKADDGTPPPGDEPKSADPAETPERDAAALERALRDGVANGTSGVAQALDVTRVPDGLLISITDDLDFAMFETASSVPSGRLVLALEAVAKVLESDARSLRIHGHTDDRPFQQLAAGTTRPGRNNWTLSSDRAHAARAMLLRGGLSPSRIVQVTGFADRKPRLPDDPSAAANRRIELLLEDAS